MPIRPAEEVVFGTGAASTASQTKQTSRYTCGQTASSITSIDCQKKAKKFHKAQLDFVMLA